MKVNHDLDEDALEITLSKKYFGLRRDVRLYFTYASPINSPYTKDKPGNVLEIIEMKYVKENDNCLIMGDLNGRTKNEDDFVIDQHDRHSPINGIPLYTRDNPSNTRKNMDSHPPDEQGKMILDLCKTSSLRILNGRTQGDLDGKYTRYPSNTKDNPSTIDYALCNEDMMGDIRSFSVLPFTGHSDHCCISVNLNVNVKGVNEISPLNADQNGDPQTINLGTPESSRRDVKLLPKKNIVKFDRTKEPLYVQALKDDPNMNILRYTVSQPTQSQESIDNIITQVNDTILEAAKKATFVKKVKVSPPKAKKTHIGWYNKECKASQRILRHTSKYLSANPFDKNARSNFVKARNRYKNLCRKTESAARQNLTNKLINLGKTDPKSFWNTIKQMNEWGRTKNDPVDDIDIDKWIDYFTKLLNDDKEVPLPVNTTPPTYEPTLDSRIKIEELRRALSKLKKGKPVLLTIYLGSTFKFSGRILNTSYSRL